MPLKNSLSMEIIPCYLGGFLFMVCFSIRS